MRTLEYNYRCYFYFYRNNEFTYNSANQSCWKLIDGLAAKEIYIDQYKTKETLKYVPLIVSYINKFTPCEVVTIGEKEYIKFTLLKSYRKSLALLNFIRYLWCSPRTNQYNDGNEFSITFFETLEAANPEEDAFTNLTIANKAGCKVVITTSDGGTGHSNHFPYHKLKDLTTKDFDEFDGSKDLAYFFTSFEKILNPY